MFETLVPGAGYGYGAQQFGPQGYLGNLYGQFGQPGAVGQQQPGGQLGGMAGGMAHGFLPFGAGQGIPGYGYATPQTVLPLTVAPGTVPFHQLQQTQPQLGPWQYGASQVPFGQQQFGQVQPQLQVIPVLTPQGLVGQLVLTIGQIPQQQIPQQQIPQISPQAMMGGVQPGLGGGGFGSQFGGGGLGGGYSPFQAQQQIPQQQIPQIPQMYIPVVPIGATNFPGQPFGAAPIH
jgi:hypothetical protein